MSSLWPPRYLAPNEAKGASTKPDEDMGDVITDAATDAVTDAPTDAVAIADIGPEHGEQPNPPQPIRPLLARSSSLQPLPPAVPPPPSQPPPLPMGSAPVPPSDSLSLAQLRRIVADFPKADPVAYDFTYEDMGPLEEEIDEWFVYQPSQWARLDAAQVAFDTQWEQDFDATKDWRGCSGEEQAKFVHKALERLSFDEAKDRLGAVGCLVYIVLGRWRQTAGGGSTAAPKDKKARSASTEEQLAAMKGGVNLFGAHEVPLLWDALRKAFDPFWYVQWTRTTVDGDKTTNNLVGRRKPSRCRQVNPRMRRMS